MTVDEVITIFANGDILKIATPEEYLVFMEYILQYPENGGTLRTVNITQDLDFTGYSFTPYNNSSNIMDLLVDGGGHTISNINLTGNGTYYILGYCNSTDAARAMSINNLRLEMCKITGYDIYIFYSYGDAVNISVSNCILTADRIVHIFNMCGYGNNTSGYTTKNLSSNNLIYCLNYSGITSCAAERFAIMDIVNLRGGSGGTAYGIQKGTRNMTIGFCRNKYNGFYDAYGIWGGSSGKASTVYIACEYSNCTKTHSVSGYYSRFTNVYYDKTLDPYSTENTNLGLTTEELKNKTVMESKGFLVAEI